MVEGPEITALTRKLTRDNRNTILKSITIRGIGFKPINLDRFRRDLPITITQFRNRGNFIYFSTNKKWTIWLTLRRNGYIYNEDDGFDRGDLNVILNTNTCNCNMYITRVHTLKFFKSEMLLDKKLAALGQDLLKEKKNYDDFWSRLKYYHLNDSICEALVDPLVIAGVGSYVRSEALGLLTGEVNPFKHVKDLTEQEVKKVLDAINTTLRTFLDPTEPYKIYGQSTFRNQQIHVIRTNKRRLFYFV